jgi:hypothetical protein
VTVVQTVTGAIAEGPWENMCTADRHSWSAMLNANGAPVFEPDTAEVTVLDYGTTFQWSWNGLRENGGSLESTTVQKTGR